MLDFIPDWIEVTYLTGWFFFGRMWAGATYRQQKALIPEYEKLSSRQKRYEEEPAPVWLATGGFVGGGFWPIVVPIFAIRRLYEARRAEAKTLKGWYLAACRAIFLGRAPRKERQRLEKQAMQERIKELETELQL